MAGKEFWESTWSRKKAPGQFNPRNYSHQRFHALFQRHLRDRSGQTFLEVGCAQSSWLPHAGRMFGCRVAGIDYSPTGCRMARQLLEEVGIPGDVHERDLFADIGDLEKTADILFSNGFIEHFEDTVGTLGRMRSLIRPGGIIITVIPNFVGWLGRIQELVNPEVYRIHVIMDAAELDRVHREAGFRTIEAGYFGSIATEVAKYPVPCPLRLRVLRKVLKKITKSCWVAFRLLDRHPESRRFSPYIVYVGLRPFEEAIRA
jgi:SAM-dependent methyltransferase